MDDLRRHQTPLWRRHHGNARRRPIQPPDGLHLGNLVHRPHVHSRHDQRRAESDGDRRGRHDREVECASDLFGSARVARICSSPGRPCPVWFPSSEAPTGTRKVEQGDLPDLLCRRRLNCLDCGSELKSFESGRCASETPAFYPLGTLSPSSASLSLSRKTRAFNLLDRLSSGGL